jgi:hypothetical protein
MVIDSAQRQMTATREFASGLIARVMLFLRQLICGLHGHDSLLHFEKGRMSLQCTSCGYETPGWDLKSTSPQPQRVQPRSRVQISLVGQRRVA